jgi:hypothetical protein
MSKVNGRGAARSQGDRVLNFRAGFRFVAFPLCCRVTFVRLQGGAALTADLASHSAAPNLLYHQKYKYIDCLLLFVHLLNHLSLLSLMIIPAAVMAS